MAAKRTPKAPTSKTTAEEQASSGESGTDPATEAEGSGDLSNDLESQMMAAMQLESMFGGGQTQVLGVGQAPTVLTRDQIEANLLESPDEEDPNTIDLETLFEDLSALVEEKFSQMEKNVEKGLKELGNKLEVVRLQVETNQRATSTDLNDLDKQFEIVVPMLKGLGQGVMALVQASKQGVNAVGQATAAPPQRAAQAPLSTVEHTPPAQQQEVVPETAPAPAPVPIVPHGVPAQAEKPILTSVPTGPNAKGIPLATYIEKILHFLSAYKLALTAPQLEAFLRERGCIAADGTVWKAG